MNKQFKINKLKIRPDITDNKSGVITHINYTAYITDGTYTAETTAWCTLPHIDLNSFVELNELTEEQVISWIIPNIKEEQLDFMLERILLKEKYGIPTEIDPPWVVS